MFQIRTSLFWRETAEETRLPIFLAWMLSIDKLAVNCETVLNSSQIPKLIALIAEQS